MHSRVRVLDGEHGGIEGYYFGLDEAVPGHGVIGPMGLGLAPISVPVASIRRMHYISGRGWFVDEP